MDFDLFFFLRSLCCFPSFCSSPLLCSPWCSIYLQCSCQMRHTAVPPSRDPTWTWALGLSGLCGGLAPQPALPRSRTRQKCPSLLFYLKKKKKDIQVTLRVTPFWTKIRRGGDSQVVLTLPYHLPHSYKEVVTERAEWPTSRGGCRSG